MTGTSPIELLRERLEELRVRLERSGEDASASREEIRDDIVGLFKEVEGMIAELEAVKDDIRPLVGRYHEQFPRPGTPPARLDHLGASTYRERGWSALAAGEFERAVDDLRRAVELDPEDAGGLALLAWAHLRLQEHELARPLLDLALARNPASSTARMCQGYLQLQEGLFAEAVESLTAVVQAGTDRTAALYAHLYLGMAHAEQGMHRDAQSCFRKALELGPNLTEAYWELGRSHHEEGRHDLALETWQAGGANRFNVWGERCREAYRRLSESDGSPAA